MAFGIVLGGESQMNANSVGMTGYQKKSSYTAITGTDSVMDAIGKLEAKEGSAVSSGGVELADVSGVEHETGNGKVLIKWADPDDLVYNGGTLARWSGTKLVRKLGSYPENISDGTVVVDNKVKNSHSTTAYTDSSLVNGTPYYYKFFPYSSDGVVTSGTGFTATPNKFTPNLVVTDTETSETVTTVAIHKGASAATKTLSVTSDSQGELTVSSSDTSVVTATVSGSTVAITWVGVGTADVTIHQASHGDFQSTSSVIQVTADAGLRYGYRIKISESDPSARVEYLFDAVGKQPAHMDFTNGVFNYGGWGNDWFVTQNKPCMLKNDGTVDYYLNPNDYTKKADGTASDVSNTSYAGNAMSEIPLVWVKRYTENGYMYEIISNIQYDSDFKAYAHTRADGSIADVFYYSMFGGSGDSSKIRSLAGQSLSRKLTAQQEIDACKANGTKWNTHTWSQHELIRTLLVLMGKSTNTQAVFGTGNIHSGAEADMLQTGTLKDKGQFFGYSDNNKQVKVFHIEKFWGDQWDRIAGLINNSGNICVKMTPEGQGYRVTDVTGYHATGKTLASSGWISAGDMSEYGFIPTTASGSETTYECDYGWTNNSQLDYALVGVSVNDTVGLGGAFCLGVDDAPSVTRWYFGCGLSCEQPAAA